MQKTKWDTSNPDIYLTLLLFKDGELPKLYLIPATSWRTPNDLLSDKEYEGLKSKPEFGLNLSAKNMSLLQQYNFKESINMLD